MVVLFCILLAMALMFGLGVALGESMGWDRCWQDLTKGDAWRDHHEYLDQGGEDATTQRKTDGRDALETPHRVVASERGAGESGSPHDFSELEAVAAAAIEVEALEDAGLGDLASFLLHLEGDGWKLIRKPSPESGSEPLWTPPPASETYIPAAQNASAVTQPQPESGSGEEGEARRAVDLAWEESGRSALDELFEAIDPRDGSMPDYFAASGLASHAWAELKRLGYTPTQPPQGSLQVKRDDELVPRGSSKEARSRAIRDASERVRNDTTGFLRPLAPPPQGSQVEQERTETESWELVRVWRCPDWPACGTTLLVGSAEDENHLPFTEDGPVCADCDQAMQRSAFMPFANYTTLQAQLQRVEEEAVRLRQDRREFSRDLEQAEAHIEEAVKELDRRAKYQRERAQVPGVDIHSSMGHEGRADAHESDADYLRIQPSSEVEHCDGCPNCKQGQGNAL